MQGGQDFTRRGKADHAVGPGADHIRLGKPLKTHDKYLSPGLRYRTGHLAGQRAATGKDADTLPRKPTGFLLRRHRSRSCRRPARA